MISEATDFLTTTGPLLSGIQVGGTDLGFWFAQQGSILTFIAITFFYAWRMNGLDKKYGLGE